MSEVLVFSAIAVTGLAALWRARDPGVPTRIERIQKSRDWDVRIVEARPPNYRSLLHDLGIALLTGAVVGLAIFVVESRRDENLELRSERRESLRFVRSVSISSPNGPKPLAGLDLPGANLDGLNLTNADLTDSNLAGADIEFADFTGARLWNVDLSSAKAWSAVFVDSNFEFADLSNAYLDDVDFTGAALQYVDFSGANLAGADLTNTDLLSVCWDDATVWPDGFDPPPPSNCPEE